MRAVAFGISLCALVAESHAQAPDLRGRVVRESGAPVPDALVTLKERGISARTGADGAFVLDGNSSIRRGPGRYMRYHLNSHFLVVDAGIPLDVRMEIADGAGRSLGACNRRLEKGHHNLALAEAMPDPGIPSGLYFLTLRLGGETFIHPFLHSNKGSRGPVFAPANPDGFASKQAGSAAKRTAVVDSLRIRKSGFRDFSMPIMGYTAGDLGDLVLSEAADAGNICARERIQRTGDGAEVVFCEALFDQPPRVRLPAATASSAYAAMTPDAFVTAAGAVYPHTLRNSAGLEMRRHASALYEIKIQGGKLESFRPAVLFAESLFLAPLMGKTFEGLVSKRTGAGRFEFAPSLPVRLHISAGPYEGGSGDDSGYQVRAVIANLTAPIKAADGACMPSLSSYGSEAPFAAGGEALILVGRVPSMHSFGDDELVFSLSAGGAWMGTLMSPAWFFTPLDLVKNALAPSGVYTGVGHGTPGSIPSLTLRLVSGGGGACSDR